MAQQGIHWKDRAIAKAEGISDGFEVLKAYGAHIAEWILFFCLIANIIEIFQLPEPFATIFGNIVLGIQSVTLDIAGFGLATMGEHARRRGDAQAASKASTMGWMLICLMIVTVGLVTLSLIIPTTKPTVDIIEKVLVLARVIVTVLYGHIVHSLRNAGIEYENRVATLQREVSNLQGQLQAKQQEVSSGQLQLSSVQKTVDTLRAQLDGARQEMSSVQCKLEAEQQRVSSLQEELQFGQGDAAVLRRELNAAQLDAEGLRARLDAKVREVEEMQADQAGIVALRRELNAAKLYAEELRAQLDAKSGAENVQLPPSSGQQRVSSRQGIRASSEQQEVSSGQGKVLQLDTNRTRKTGQDEIEFQIRALLKERPGLSGRAVAMELGCSPTTAAKWKSFIENENLAANG